MDTYSKLINAVVSLLEIRRKVVAAGEFGDLYESARYCLFKAFEALADNLSGGVVCLKVCERDGAMLAVVSPVNPGGVLTHMAKDDKWTAIDGEHEVGGGLGSIVVGGHEWRWSEMVDGVFAAFGLVTASKFSASDRILAEIRKEFDERTAEPAKSPEAGEPRKTVN